MTQCTGVKYLWLNAYLKINKKNEIVIITLCFVHSLHLNFTTGKVWAFCKCTSKLNEVIVRLSENKDSFTVLGNVILRHIKMLFTPQDWEHSCHTGNHTEIRWLESDHSKDEGDEGPHSCNDRGARGAHHRRKFSSDTQTIRGGDSKALTSPLKKRFSISGRLVQVRITGLGLRYKWSILWCGIDELQMFHIEFCPILKTVITVFALVSYKEHNVINDITLMTS